MSKYHARKTECDGILFDSRMTRITAPTEHEEQAALMDWIYLTSWKYPELNLFYHVPNEGKRSPAAAMKLLAEGLKKGVPDNFLPVARGGYHGLYIELKRTKGGKLSPEQRQWLDGRNHVFGLK